MTTSQPAAQPAAQSTTWDPQRYLRFADQRIRPFRDLLNQVPVVDPRTVVDLGCGPGNATAAIADRWPAAHVLGVDSSAEMITAARTLARPPALDFQLADLRAWRPAEPVDVLITNATLQWIPGHLDLLPDLLARLAPGGCLAMGVPGNFTAPSHALLTDLQRTDRWASVFTGSHLRPASHEPVDYLRALTAAGAQAEVWETTYIYVLDGPDGVLDFVSSTALRPVLAELAGSGDPAAADEFVAQYSAALREAYPPGPLGGRTVQILPYRRIFAVAVLPD